MRIFTAAFLLFSAGIPGWCADNLIADPSFEITKAPDQFGRVFSKWEGWKFEGDCAFGIGKYPHTGKTSAQLSCKTPGKIRINQPQNLAPGRYLIEAYLRGENIGTGAYGAATEFMFNDKYMQLKLTGTFGWTYLAYVVDVTAPVTTGPSFGLWGPGTFWIDDVSMKRVDATAKLTEMPVLTGPAPGTPAPNNGLPSVKPITSFEQNNPFAGGTVVTAHATEGTHALRINSAPAIMQAAQNWEGYDFLKIDTYTDAHDSVQLTIEIQDTGTKDYWTRVNYITTVAPGNGAVILPLKQLYVGEKGRPGRNLLLSGITRIAVTAGAAAAITPVFLDNLRLERDDTAAKALFKELLAFDFGPAGSPILDGYREITPATVYTPARGYGLKNARVWRAFNVLQPDPLYQDYLCIEAGGLAMDVPNGRYRVVVNIDAAAGFWGETQLYRERSIVANGKTVLLEKLNFQAFQKKYFHFWDKDDLPTENTFDKYGGVHFSEKTFDVEVTNGQLFVEFLGENWANSVSFLVAFPITKAAEGEHFLEYTKNRRRFYFENSFHRVLHRPAGDALQPSLEETKAGLVFFQRDLMSDVFYNDTPFRLELGKPLSGDAFPGQNTTLVAGVVPLRDLGQVHASIGNLTGTSGTIAAANIEIGYGSYRLRRVSSDGAVYTIVPRYVMPLQQVTLPKGLTRTFWVTVRVPPGTAPGTYTGQLTLTSQQRKMAAMDVLFQVRHGSIDRVDIPVGPFGGGIRSPWYEDDFAASKLTASLSDSSLRLLSANGFTMVSGLPTIEYHGFSGKKPDLDFSTADKQMQRAKQLGFLAVSSYGAGITGMNSYVRDEAAMKAAGYTDYTSFIQAIYTTIERHAVEKGWIKVYWNLGDEPSGDDLKKSISNAEAYRAAFPQGPPFFTIPTSLNAGHDATDLNFVLAKTFHVASLSLHDEPGVNLLRANGGQWGLYDFGDRWNFGTYMYKAAQQFDMKFRIAWHWNIAAGDPYYALDCREDDFTWANASPDGKLVPSIEFLRISAGLDDYRELLTLARLAKLKRGSSAAKNAEDLIEARMSAFHLNQKDHDALFGSADWTLFRQKLNNAIEALQ